MRTISSVTGVGLIFQIAAVSAQQPAPAEPAHQVYVISGCLEHGSAATSVFKLVDATAVGQMPPNASKTDGGAAAGDGSYEVLPVSSVSEQGISRETLESHVGRRIEVTVRPIEAQVVPPSATATSKPTAPKGEQSLPPRYTAVKINKVLGACEIDRR